MEWCNKIIIALLVLCFSSGSANAQEAEYKMELGVMGGGNFYLGDLDYSTPFKSMRPTVAAFARYNLNPRMSLKFDIGYGKIAGDATKSKNKFPELTGDKLKFSYPLVDFGCQYEISFWGYGTGTGYKGTKRLVPYIQAGFGFTYCNVFTANIPIGIGIKYKFAPRWNVGLDWTMRFAMSDKLDKIQDPYNIKSGFLKNKDTYSWTMITISYDMFQKLRKCNN